MKFKSYEKSAIARLLVLIVGADGEIEKNEMMLSTLLLKRMDTTSAEIQESEKMNASQAFSIVSGMATDKRRLVCAMLGDLILVDGDINPTEMAVWTALSSICNFPNMTIGEAHSIVAEYLNIL